MEFRFGIMSYGYILYGHHHWALDIGFLDERLFPWLDETCCMRHERISWVNGVGQWLKRAWLAYIAYYPDNTVRRTGIGNHRGCKAG